MRRCAFIYVYKLCVTYSICFKCQSYQLLMILVCLNIMFNIAQKKVKQTKNLPSFGLCMLWYFFAASSAEAIGKISIPTNVGGKSDED